MISTMSTPASAASTASSSRTLSQTLAAFAHSLEPDDIPHRVRVRAKHLILDTIGIALASHRNEFASVILRGINALGESGTTPVIGCGDTHTVRNAVLLNAALMHGLDYDDTHMKGIVHASAFCAPTALAVAHETGASGRAALAAYVVGMEVATRLGAAAKGGFHRAGYHPTGVLSHFSAALIAGRLYRLDTAQLAAAQGIAASTASGVQVFLEEGTWSKRLHPGWGGVGGITAARLAQAGFVAPSRPYEGRYGLFDSHLQQHAGDVDYLMARAGLGEIWETEQMAIKPYPVCHFLHSIAEAGAALARDASIDPQRISRIRALLPQPVMPIVTEPLDAKRCPRTNYEAKFSAQYVAAASLVRGRFGLAELEPDALADPRILALSARVECVADTDSAFPAFYSGGIIVDTDDGRQHRRYYRINKGAGERALSNEEIVAKYFDNACWSVSRARAEQIRNAVLSLDEMSAAELWAVLRAG
ncbi:MmgE/PrpD family protein [Paraburkholderia sp. ZP32-5]|uniref:MmgE/PrpD family protein n=1 Tax=Paraburkholderia sp. ZP32-5 TaxID=2883245 RepID=UPI001F399785|nr:MmgE/PrpD family protein [Paraburkholderia sp. ZP32-5]